MAGGEENALQEEAVIESADELRHPVSLVAVRLEDYHVGLRPRRPRPDGRPLG